MNITSTIITTVLSIIGATKDILKVDRQNDIHTLRACLKCEKKTRKIVEKCCFQCYYDKSEVQH